MAKKRKTDTTKNDLVVPSGEGEVLLYQTPDGQSRIEVHLENETVWLTQNQMAELFQTSKQNVSLHIRNIFDEQELSEAAVVMDSLTTAADGKNYRTSFYNLDVIISVGYRVKSHRGTQFRIWATQRLREYLIKGFTMDDERLKKSGGGDYFDELLARIRDICSSEKVFWKKVLEIYATSSDYDPKDALPSPVEKHFEEAIKKLSSIKPRPEAKNRSHQFGRFWAHDAWSSGFSLRFVVRPSGRLARGVKTG